MQFIGVDPGLDGAIVTLSEEGNLITFYKMPTIEVSDSKRLVDENKLYDIIERDSKLKPTFFIEHITGPVPKTALQSAFTFGRTYQAVLSTFHLSKIPYELVHSKKWKGSVLNNTDKGKKAAINWFNTKFPDRKTSHDGIADAACIAEYGRRLTLGVN